MLVETETVLRYINSFTLFVYRLLDMTRMAPSPELHTVLKNEVLFLYRLLCLMVYNDNFDTRIESLVNWGASLGADIKLDVFKDMYLEKIKQLQLDKFEPKQFVFSFSTIWDSIHLMCLIGDDMVLKRQLYNLETVAMCIKNLKYTFYNIFIVLFCPICAKHYLTIDTFPYEFECVEVALYREKMGEPIALVEEINKNNSHKNVLIKHHLLYKSMVFHNHVNNYRPIQHNKNEFNNFQRMKWSILKSLVGIN